MTGKFVFSRENPGVSSYLVYYQERPYAPKRVYLGTVVKTTLRGGNKPPRTRWYIDLDPKGQRFFDTRDEAARAALDDKKEAILNG